MVEFANEKDVQEWASTLSREELAVFAGRAAARLLPLVETWDEAAARQLDLICCRAIMGALVLGMFATTASIRATVTARTAALTAAHKAAAAARTAVDSDPAASTAGLTLDVAADAAGASVVATDSDVAALGDAADAAAAVAYASAYADTVADDDATLLDTRAGVDGLARAPLWPDRDSPRKIGEMWRILRARWSQDPETWSFWIDWYEGLLEGRAPDWELWRDVALIKDDHWKAGPEAVAGEIDKIRKRRATLSEADIPHEVEEALARQGKGQPSVVEFVRDAIERNRESLPPTFDAIEGLILLEIERLQQDNYLNMNAPEHVAQSIGVLLTLFETLQKLRATIPQEGPVGTEVAERSEGLLRLYARKFAELPREKVDEVKDGVWDSAKGAGRVSLIFASTALAGSLLPALPAHLAFAGAAMVFAPKQAGDLLKAAKELFAQPK